MAVELARAYVTLVPSFEGAQAAIATGLGGLDSEFDKAGKRGGGLLGAGLLAALPVAAIAAGVGAAFAGLFSIGSTFDQVSDTIRAGTGATGDALAGLEAVAERVGRTVPASFEQAGTVVADLNTRLGLSGDTLELVASQYLEAGRVLGTEVDVQATTAAFSAFRIEGDGVSAAMDQLFRVSQATGVGMNELAGVVSQAAPAMLNLGFSFEETAALAGTLDKAGLNTSQIVSSLSRSLVTLAADGEAPEDAFRRVTAQLQSFVDQGNDAAALDLAGQVFGTRGAAQLVGALQSGKVALDDLVAGAGLTGDTILGVGAETRDFAESWTVLKNNALAALEPIGTALFDGLGTVFAFLAEQSQGLSPLFERIGAAVAPIFERIGAVVAELAPTFLDLFLQASPLMVLFRALEPVLPQIAEALAAVGAAVGGALSGALSALMPVISEVLGVVAATFADVLVAMLPVVLMLADLFAELVQAVMPLLEPILALLAPILALIAPLAQLIGAILPPIIGLFVALLEPILALITPLIEGLVPVLGFVAEALALVIGWVADAIGWFVDLVTGSEETRAGVDAAWSAVLGFFDKLWVDIGTFFSEGIASILQFFADLPGGILRALGDLGRVLYEAGRDLINGLLEGAGSLLRNIGQFFLDLVPDWIVGPFKDALGISSPSRVFADLGGDLVAGLVLGVEAGQEDVSTAITSLVPLPASSYSPGAAGLGGISAAAARTVNYYAAPNQSLDSELDLRVALARAEVLLP